jgi:hypothetical protein
VGYQFDYKNGKSTVTFKNLMWTQTNPVIAFGSDALKLFNIWQDYRQLIFLVDNQTVKIAFDSI